MATNTSSSASSTPAAAAEDSSNTSKEFPALETFKEAFATIRELPYCSGHVELNENASTIFYRGPNTVSAVDFLCPTEEQLAELAAACQPASFGRDNEDVLDDSYRKAGKMDNKNFSAQFSPVEAGIIDAIRESLLQGENAQKEIRPELYKLNVYGPGSFFKAHVDTPRSDAMFGSLVVVLPTQHEGGSLIFRHKGEEVTFDTAQAVSASTHPSPHAAYVAFFSDVEHEVSLVRSGYRVTLTYNLYYTQSPAVTRSLLEVVPENSPLAKLKPSLSSLLADPEFLPDGGLFAFQLSHKYPFKVAVTTNLADLMTSLKGSDAIIKQLCEEIGLPVKLKALYAFTEDESKVKLHALVNEFVNFNRRDILAEQPINRFLRKRYKGVKFAYPYPGEEPYLDWYTSTVQLTPTVWVQMNEACNTWDQQYMTYGNEKQLKVMYGEVCLVARVKPANERSVG